VHTDGQARGLVVAALFAALAACVCSLVTAPAAPAKEAGVESQLEGVRPPADGLELEVAGGDRFLVLNNATGEEVVVKGYDDEPYLRFLPTRVVEVNTRSPSKYANEDRYALRPVPAQADSNAPPKWQAVSRSGSYRWFDHRIHLMEKGTPPQVKDESKRTKIFDWNVPMTVGGESARALGTLEWVPESSSDTSPLLFAGLGALALLIVGGGLVLIRRRRGTRPAGAGGPKPVEEAW
jgi:LPXTG-motif cell wall-anchored protein